MHRCSSPPAPAHRPRHVTAALFAMALVVTPALSIHPAQANDTSDPPPDADADPDASWREPALAIYAERCGVAAGSAQQRYARSDWDQLRTAGYGAELLFDLTVELPMDCEDIAFKVAVLAMERERERAASAPPPGDRGPLPTPTLHEDDLLVDTRDFLRPMVGVGWTMTGLGLTLFGVGLAGDLDGAQVVGTIGGQLFMSSLFITSIAGTAVFRNPEGVLGPRDLRWTANGFLAVGGGLLVLDLIVLYASVGSLLSGGGGADDVAMAVMTYTALGCLITSTIQGQIANTALLKAVEDELGATATRHRRASPPRPRLALLPIAHPDGGGAAVIGRW